MDYAAGAAELQSVCEECGALDCETKPTFRIWKEPDFEESELLSL